MFNQLFRASAFSILQLIFAMVVIFAVHELALPLIFVAVVAASAL